MINHDVLWTDVARCDLDDIANYIAEEDGIDAALEIVCRLERKAAKLVNMPKRGVIVPELLDIGVLQYHQLTERPWRIIYPTFRTPYSQFFHLINHLQINHLKPSNLLIFMVY